MIYLIRHGQTAKNKAMVLQGRQDEPLNDDGVRQAERARELFRAKGITFDRVYSSPLQRALRTARIVAPEAEVLTDDRLLEMDYGPYEGTSLVDPAPEVLRFFQDFVHNPAPEGMEPLSAVTARLGDFLRALHGTPGNILIATHAIAMKGALEYLTPDSKGEFWAKHIRNCDVYAAEMTENGYTVPVEVK